MVPGGAAECGESFADGAVGQQLGVIDHDRGRAGKGGEQGFEIAGGGGSSIDHARHPGDFPEPGERRRTGGDDDDVAPVPGQGAGHDHQGVAAPRSGRTGHQESRTHLGEVDQLWGQSVAAHPHQRDGPARWVCWRLLFQQCVQPDVRRQGGDRLRAGALWEHGVAFGGLLGQLAERRHLAGSGRVTVEERHLDLDPGAGVERPAGGDVVGQMTR